MSLEAELQRGLKDLLNMGEFIFPVVVTAVNEQNNTCKAVDAHGIEYPDVRLNGIIKEGNALVVIPKIKSVVQVSPIGTRSAGNLMAVKVHDPEKVICKFGEMSAEISEAGIKLNGDDLGGMVKAKELKLQIDKNTAVLNKLLEVIRLTPPSGGIPEPGNGSPSALQAALRSAVVGLTTADLSTIENNNVKHG